MPYLHCSPRWRATSLVGLFGASAMACGGSSGSNETPHALSQLRDVQLTALVDYNPPQPPPTPGVIASLTYTLAATCPSLNITATLDGVPLAFSPAVTGGAGAETCNIGFFLTQTVSSAPQSVLAFSDGVTQSSLTATRLLEPRGLSTSFSDGGAVHTGDVIALTWSTDSDTIGTTDAYFYSDGGSAHAATQASGTTVSVTVPPLAPGAWTLETTVLAAPPIVACSGATSCGVEVTAHNDLSVTAP
jgi:hypothetical protein